MAFQFNVPPVNKLSLDQQHAIKVDLGENECLMITGCPGSGKTTVANFRASSLQREKKKFKYIIYAKLLEAYVRKSFGNPELKIAEDKVGTFASWFYKRFKRFVLDGPNKVRQDVVEVCFKGAGKEFDEMIFDETQDIDVNVIKNLPFITHGITICADDAQNVYEGDDVEHRNTVAEMKRVLDDKKVNVSEVYLSTNYRNPPEVYNFAKAFIPNNPAGKIERFIKEPGQKPFVIFLNSKVEMYERIHNLVKSRRTENIGILCDRTDQVNSIAHFLKQKNVEHTFFHSKLEKDDQMQQLANMKNVVICTNKSAKGLEFQTVIIPFVEELKTDESSRKSYYVACTRAERSLFLMASSNDRPATLIAQISKSLYEKS